MSAGISLLLTWIQAFACRLVSVRTEQQIITAESGQNITLTCRAPNNIIIVVEWSRTDLESEYVLLYRDGQFDPEDQHPSFKNRVDLQDRQMKDGDVSVILKNVTFNDTGTYECRVVTEETRSLKLIINIYLRVVAPPGQPRGLREDGGKEDGGKEDGGKEDGGKEDGFIPMILSLAVFAVFLVVLIWIKQLRNRGSYNVSW